MHRSRATVQIGFDASPGSLDPVWTNSGFTWSDVSADALEYEVGAGGGEFEGVVPGSGTVVLDNTAGTYDPSNAGSGFFGDMTSGKPIRILEQVNLVDEFVSSGDSITGLAAVGGASLAVSATQARSVLNSVRVDSAAGTIGFTTPAGTSGYPVFAGEPLTAAVWVKRTSATGRQVTVSLRFFDAAGSTISTVSGTAVTSSTSWQQVYVTTTAPATAAYCALRVEAASAVVGDVHYVDDLAIVPAAYDAVKAPGALVWFPGGRRPVFRGQIDSWLPMQLPPGESVTTLQVSGILAALAEVPYGPSLWATFVERSRPELWWRLGERAETDPVVDSSGNGHHGRYRRDQGGTPVTFTEGLIAQDPDGAVNFDATWRQYVEGGSFSWPSGTFTVALWVKGYASASACTLFDSSRLTIAMTAAGAIAATYLGLAATTTGRDVRDGDAHLVVVTCDAGGAVQVSIDMDATASNSGILSAERLMLRLYVARDQAGTGAQFATVTIDEVVIWDAVQLDPTWLYLCGRAMGVRAGDPVGRPQPADVAQFLLDTLGSPRPLGTTASPAGDGPNAVDVVPMSAPLDMLNIAATMGQLVVVETAEGEPTVLPVAYVPTTTSALLSTVTIGAGAGEYPYLEPVELDFGESSVINHLTVSRPDIAAVVYRDTASIAARGLKPSTITVWSTVDRVARDLAGWLLYQYSGEGRRLTGIRPDCSRIDTLQAMLHVSVGDVVTVKDTTVDGRTITTVARVTGKRTARMRGDRGLAVMRIGLQLAPVRVQPMLLDDGTYGGLDTGGIWGP